MTGPYDRIKVENGQILDRRGLALHKQAKTVFDVLGGRFHPVIVQGSFSTSIGASAGTHAGGGAKDTMLPDSASHAQWMLWQKAQRFCGIAAFDRPELWSNGKRVWGHHDHAIDIGDKLLSYDARKQITDYYAHKNALASHLRDTSWHPSVIFTPRYPLWNIDLSNVRAEAKKTRGYVVRTGVKRFQYVLNIKIGANLKVDGIFGRSTKLAVSRWELNVGGDGDGIPGEFASVLLGAGFFHVNP
jgi:hypothetical protein